jgi:hypothetical protein
VKKSNPERFCLLEYDKLIIDQKIYVWNDVISQVRKKEKNTHYIIIRELNGSQGYVITRGPHEPFEIFIPINYISNLA